MPAFDFTAPPALPPELAGAAVATVGIDGARAMPPVELSAAVTDAYLALDRRLRDAGGRHMVRIWNFIPALLEDAGDGTNRYMAFNAGRWTAMRTLFGDESLRRAPAGTGVGCPGDAVIIHGWATPAAGRAVQNPRQVPAEAYSARYGPRPPCFARATRVGGLLLVSGTAGINGEDTVDPDHLGRQLDLTLEHLAALAGGLDQYRSLRAYVPRANDVATVRRRLAGAVPGVGPVTPVVTDLCRPELRVEIEGVAVDIGRP